MSVKTTFEYEPSADLLAAADDPGWLDHWRKLAQKKLARKRKIDGEAADLRLRIALIDAHLKALERPLCGTETAP